MSRSEQTYAAGKFEYEDKGEKKQHADRQGAELRSLKYAEGGPEERTDKKVEDSERAAQEKRCAQAVEFFPCVRASNSMSRDPLLPRTPLDKVPPGPISGSCPADSL